MEKGRRKNAKCKCKKHQERLRKRLKSCREKFGISDPANPPPKKKILLRPCGSVHGVYE